MNKCSDHLFYRQIQNQNMKKITSDHQTLWIDKTLAQQAQKDKENINYINLPSKTINEEGKTTSRVKNFLFQIPFAERFKDKLFAFNRIGNMYKLDESQTPHSIKASMIFTRSQMTKNPCLKSVFKSKRRIIDIKKIDGFSRVSLQSNDTQRQTKSLDTSKITTVFAKQIKGRYALDCSEIKEQEVEQTIIKKPTNLRKIYTPLEPRRGKQNLKRAILFESEGTIEQSQNCQKHEKLFFKKARQVNFDADLTQKDQKRLPQLINRPNQSHLSKRLTIKKSKRQSINTQNKQELLPKIKFPNSKRKLQQDQEQLLTIR